jgi:PAS domain S-box-containing protein
MGLHNHHLEKQLKEKDKWLEMINENLNEGLVAIDRKGVIQLMNPAAEFYTGWKQEMAVGLPHQDVLSTVNEYTGGPVAIPFFRVMEEVIEVGLREDTQLKGLDDSTITIDGKCVPVVDEKGNITGAMLVFHDITQRKRLENQLHQSQKMEAIGTLASGITHDFNNILSAILGNTELAIKKLPNHNNIRHYLDRVLTAAGRAAELVKQILIFCRQSKEKKMPVQFSLIVKEVLQLIRSSLPANIEIHQDIKAPKVLLMADPIQVYQIMMNLCTNSLHAMKETGGVLGVSLEETETSLCLSISDTGHGMDSQTMARIFEPYFTTKDTEEGTGMGLAAVHGIIKNHKGTIDVSSTPGKGATFNVYLPKISSRVQGKPPTPQPFTRNKKRILFVDDEQPFVDLGRELLGQIGYTVIGRTSSIKALEDFRETPQQFDLAILDYVMPQMNGSQLAKKLLEIRPDFPIILCTGFSKIITVRQARDVGIKEIVMKPIITESLSSAIRNLLDNKK